MNTQDETFIKKDRVKDIVGLKLEVMKRIDITILTIVFIAESTMFKLAILLWYKLPYFLVVSNKTVSDK